MPKRRSDSGAVAVEFAMLVMPLLLLLCGIVDFGYAYNQQISVTAAAREGARTMAVQNDLTATRSSVRAATPVLSPALTDAQITISPQTCAVGSTVTVTVKYPMGSITGLFNPLMNGKQLTGIGVMRCSG